jgi:hypothetical protein
MTWTVAILNAKVEAELPIDLALERLKEVKT